MLFLWLFFSLVIRTDGKKTWCHLQWETQSYGYHWRVCWGFKALRHQPPLDNQWFSPSSSPRFHNNPNIKHIWFRNRILYGLTQETFTNHTWEIWIENLESQTGGGMGGVLSLGPMFGPIPHLSPPPFYGCCFKGEVSTVVAAFCPDKTPAHPSHCCLPQSIYHTTICSFTARRRLS